MNLGQLGKVKVVPASENRMDLLEDLLLFLRVLGQEVKRRGQRTGRRVVPSEEEQEQVVDQLRPG
jgi:hypothetical protein